MKKNLIGLCNNLSVNLTKAKIWARSFQKHCPDGLVTLLCANATPEELQSCLDLGINAVNVDVHDHGTINHQRVLYIKNYLQSHFSDDDVFLSTDVFDVVFQKDPFEKFDLNQYDIFVSEEGVKVHEEPWNFRNISALFPQDLESCLYFPVINSGVIGGKRNALIDLYERLYALCESSTIETIRDQAGLHVMLAKNQVEKVKIFKVKEAWAVHCAIAGPTPFFESWGFKDKMIASETPIPVLEEDGIVKVNGETVCLVHQYNRCWWSERLPNEYVY